MLVVFRYKESLVRCDGRIVHVDHDFLRLRVPFEGETVFLLYQRGRPCRSTHATIAPDTKLDRWLQHRVNGAGAASNLKWHFPLIEYRGVLTDNQHITMHPDDVATLPIMDVAREKARRRRMPRPL